LTAAYYNVTITYVEQRAASDIADVGNMRARRNVALIRAISKAVFWSKVQMMVGRA